MALFPDISPGFPTTITPSWRTVITDMESGRETRTQTRLFPLRTFELTFNQRELSESGKAILDFFNAQKGAARVFRLVWRNAEDWAGEYVERGDGVETTFTLPCKSGVPASAHVFVDGVEVVATFSAGSGPDGLDQVVLSAPPALGTVITANFTGKLAPQVRFEDRQSVDYVMQAALRYGLVVLHEAR